MKQLLILLPLSMLIVGAEGGVAGGAGCGGSSGEEVGPDEVADSVCPDIACPTTDEVVCDPNTVVTTEECDSEPGLDLPDCETGWVCRHHTFSDKSRLNCWCGNIPGGERD